ncbi:uncharacterized protein [Prorops nasuta]|uniref:uncharacterized protein n=1 Tax=Prorops nasuta TaxID=863751 RepID=UPI0034D00B4B
MLLHAPSIHLKRALGCYNLKMEKELLKILTSYFSNLQKLDESWKALANEAERPLQALANQSEQLCHVTKEENDKTEICQIENLREKLIFKILMGLEDEMSLILEILNKFNNANQNLKNRLYNLERTRNKCFTENSSMTEIMKSTTFRPQLNLLLEWAIDGYNYYHQLYLQISNSLKNLDYTKQDTIENLRESFKEDRFKRDKIDRILAFTQFLSKEAV